MSVKAHVIVNLYIALLVLSIVFTYGLAALQKHVDFFVPYLGYLGHQPVESTFFTQLFVIVAVMYALIVQIQYVWVTTALNNTAVLRAEANIKSNSINDASMVAGYTSAAGLFVMACFQESYLFYVYTAVELVYLISGQVYFLLQTFISKEENHPKTTFRLVLNILMLLFFLSFASCYITAALLFEKNWEDRHHWGKDDGGWIPYLLSSSSEWVLISLFQVYILTFIPEFKFIHITNTSIVVIDKNL